MYEQLSVIFGLASDVCVLLVSSDVWPTGKLWYGVDITKESITNNFDAFVWEPAVVKLNAITGATEAASLILSVDETIRNPKSSVEPSGPPVGRRGRRPPR